MKISSINLSRLHNAAHSALMKHFSALITKYTAAKLDVTALLTPFTAAQKAESDYMAQTLTSDISDMLVKLDNIRDAHYRAFVAYVKALTGHYDANIAKAAGHVWYVLDAKGNVPGEPYNDETNEISDMMTELKNKNTADLTAANLTEWLALLKNKNDAFDAAYKDRNNQQGAKIHADTQALRKATDVAYNNIVKRINALIEINGDAAYKAFVSEYNEYLETEKNLIAQREGRAEAAKKDAKENAAPASKTVPEE